MKQLTEQFKTFEKVKFGDIIVDRLTIDKDVSILNKNDVCFDVDINKIYICYSSQVLCRKTIKSSIIQNNKDYKIIFATNLGGVKEYTSLPGDNILKELRELREKYYSLIKSNENKQDWGEPFCNGIHACITFLNILINNQSQANSFTEEHKLKEYKRIIDEEFLLNTQKYSPEYHKMYANKIKRVNQKFDDYIQSLQPNWQWLPLMESVCCTPKGQISRYIDCKGCDIGKTKQIKTDANGKEMWEWKNINEK